MKHQRVAVRVAEERHEAHARVKWLAVELDACVGQTRARLRHVVDMQRNRRSRRVVLHPHLLWDDDAQRQVAGFELGVPAFWVVDPRVKKPSLTVFELADGCYQQAAQVSGDEVYRAERPFPVAVTPAALVAGLITE